MEPSTNVCSMIIYEYRYAQCNKYRYVQCNYVMFIFYRIMYTVTPMFVGEIVSEHLRGRFLTVLTFFAVSGYTVSLNFYFSSSGDPILVEKVTKHSHSKTTMLK